MRREPRYVLRGVPRPAEEFTNELLPKGHAETENGKDKTYTIDNQNICRHPLVSHRASINSLLANTGWRAKLTPSRSACSQTLIQSSQQIMFILKPDRYSQQAIADAGGAPGFRSAERREGNECVSTGR